ncbi:hypothetical protein PDK03_07075 [Bacillus cereus group sp. TH204-1LC]|uniref:hypothetical protein n=1 Tax=Bacillus cereus group sp. TH204-1LC TaxID=3018054 RepID=UPI0022E024C4|nr:hypothetical protein [Bacillus cereus group sp. TH204-1LC]MDA1616358.1 hypothetical protein [Bacillus cereus group sp. TH204-1LC]
MNINQTEMIAMYFNTLNNQAQVLSQQSQALTQQTQALQQGLAFVQQPQTAQTQPVQPIQQEQPVDVNVLVQQQINAMMPALMKQAADAVQHTSEVPAPFIPPQPVVEDIVEDPAPQEYVLGNKQYDLYVRIDKPCKGCPFASSCDLKASHIAQECGIMNMKEAAVDAGIMEVKIEVNEQTMTTSYLVYKDGQFIGSLADNRENKTLRAELEKYMGHTVRVMTHLKKNVANSTFTGLYAEILEVVEEVKQAQPVQSIVAPSMFDESILIPEVKYPEPPTQPEEATLDLGDIVLPI